jgi:hypothetical protein
VEVDDRYERRFNAFVTIEDVDEDDVEFRYCFRDVVVDCLEELYGDSSNKCGLSSNVKHIK